MFVPRVKDIIGGAWMIHRVIHSCHHGNGYEFIKAFMPLHSPAIGGGEKKFAYEGSPVSIGAPSFYILSSPPLQYTTSTSSNFPPCLFFFFLFSFCFFISCYGLPTIYVISRTVLFHRVPTRAPPHYTHLLLKPFFFFLDQRFCGEGVVIGGGVG